MLLVWELGANLGHLATLGPLANRLHAAGHEVTVALQKIDGAGLFFEPGVRVVLAPFTRQPQLGLPPKVWADVLREFGWADPYRLVDLVRAWRSLFDLVQPDSVVVDSAPTALLALRGSGIAVRGMTVPYSVPAPFDPLPLWEHLPEHRDREQALVEVANLATPVPLTALRDLFDGIPWHLTAPAVIDPWLAYRGPNISHVGAAFVTDRGGDVDWPEGEGPKIFVYIAARYPRLQRVLAALKGSRAIVVSPGHRNQERASVVFRHEPARLAPLIASADLCITHAISGTGLAFLQGGVPVLLLPSQVQQGLEARCASALEGVRVHTLADPGTEIPTHVNALLRERDGAQRTAALLPRSDPVEAVFAHL